MKGVLVFFCAFGVLAQNVYSQAIGVVNGGCGCNSLGLNSVVSDYNGINGINGLGNDVTNFGAGYGVGANLGIGNLGGNIGLANYGGNIGCGNGGTSSTGYGEVAVIGELPIVGSTAVTGNLPVIGYVTFEGTLPAGGLVSLLNNGNCGCSFA